MRRIIYKTCIVLILALIVFLGVIYSNDIYRFYIKYLDSSRKHITIENLEYSTSGKLKGIELTDNFIAQDAQHLFNIYYTIVNSGNTSFTFYCDIDYDDCINDVNSLSTNDDRLSIINDIVHPYNSFDSIQTTYTTNGKIIIEIKKKYTTDQINTINNKVTGIINKNISNSSSDKEKIKIIHDYIINHTKYDDNKNKVDINNTAYEVLVNGKGMCGGYSDTMAIFLYQLGINNFKISNSKHVWNYVELNNKWYHLDLTWDDPVTSNGTNLLKYYYYLIDENKLNRLNNGEHDYDKKIYIAK